MFNAINIPFNFSLANKTIKMLFYLCQLGGIAKHNSSYFQNAIIQKRLVCSLNKNNKKQLRRTMQKYPLKEDNETEVLFNDSCDQSKQALNPSQQFTTINAIMDQIHQEVISKKVMLRGKDSEDRKVQCKKWGRKQTENFYLLLSKMGPDFTNMELHDSFNGNRCKRQLKNKYRKEQKKDGGKVNSFLDMYYDRKCVEKMTN